jgi:alginate O-acetyltransferase complex protein AlgI
MNVCSIEFLLLLLLGTAAFVWIPTTRLRQAFLAACNLGFLCTQVPDWRAWAALGVFVISGYVMVWVIRRHPSRRVLTVYLTLLVVGFLVLKRYEFVTLVLPPSMLSHTIVIVGLSYALFRQIHVAVDALQGQIKDLSFWTYANYQTNLFGLLAGPIQRYQDFSEDWNRLVPLPADRYDHLRAYARVFVGVIKIVMVAGYCLYYYETSVAVFVQNVHQPVWKDWLRFLMLFYLYPAYIYFNFSGYCDIVIGGASLVGIGMPENFDLPFLSRNMIEYWTRWHKTLGFWIRDYVFTPMYMSIAKRWPAQAASLAFLCYFVALFLTGVWHGSTWNFVIFGLLNGLGVATAKLWEYHLIRRRGRKGFNAYLQSRPVRILCVVGTFHFACLTIFFFPADLHKTVTVLCNFISRVT